MNNEVIIRNQVWMSENLNVDKFRNGDAIPEVKTYEEFYKIYQKNKKNVFNFFIYIFIFVFNLKILK